ncbi:serine/threonine protein kinase [Actinospica sp. MGRD01-02]|uniref:Serine/threonine protein kinase n=2 Tax=Actinospica acidithermotolerans TaxID=2828514 RepID=A0A941E6V4_9ACTN|nr:serine/threonine protein kinase [Actinospica acidithermotolerans]
MDRTIAEPLGPDDPREIGQFTIIGLLGAGGMGEVYLGTTGEEYVAVKRVRPRLVSGERFKREVGILFRVPVGVAPSVLATDGTVAQPWFAAEYVPGLTVDEAVRLHGPLSAETLWLLLAETAAQLRRVHEIGIVHRDLKPANVMLVRDGVKLIDFGIARAADQERLTRSGGSYGTRGFTAPEQEAGDENVAAPADVFALGALLVYAASGRTPGVVPDIEAMRAVDADLAELVASCFAERPDERPTAAALEELARMHAPADPSWPEAVEARIEARREFAATPVGKLETLPPPDEETEPPPAPFPAPRVGQPGKNDPEHRKRWRLVTLPIAVVLVVGAVIAYVLVPSTSSARAGAQGTATTTGNQLVASTKSDTASSSPHPSHSASATSTSTVTLTVAGETTADAGAGSPTTTPASAPATTAATTRAATVVTAASISGVSGNDDPEHVSGSEGDVDYYAGNAAGCSAWLDTNGTGNLAGVLNTSGFQACGAELYRSDGIHFEFEQSTGAAKTNFISDEGYTMYICVWDKSDTSTVSCGHKFTMSGTTPVEQ